MYYISIAFSTYINTYPKQDTSQSRRLMMENDEHVNHVQPSGLLLTVQLLKFGEQLLQLDESLLQLL